ncbi:hypothetical protein EDD85DRAFT_919320 [Armillaria nabsnona]|nr:hypothetical protein EDD85DRAFT_919320 [Armillaria nabsnona]
MSSKSLKNHLKSTKHDSHRIRKDNQETQRHAELQRLNNAYQGASLLNASTSSVPLTLRPGMFSEDDLDSPPNNEDVSDYFNCCTENKDFSPYPNKTACIFNLALLDVLDNLPRLQLSLSHMQLILWLLHELGAPDVPSYKTLRAMQKSLWEICGSVPQVHKSGLGNHFYVNDIHDSITQDFFNPEVAKHLQFYPEDTNGPISEDYKPSELTPMYSQGLCQFYIDELAQLKDGSYVVPRNWIIRNGELHADCNEAGHFISSGWCLSPTTRSIATTEFMSNYEDITARTVLEMPNPLRKLTQGDDLYVVMVPIWADDISGNKSKQYNKHINLYAVNSCLPGQLLQQEYFIRFVLTSPHATSPEQFSALRDQVWWINPVRCFNTHTKQPCHFILHNPQQSEEASHIGGNGNLPCRKCHVGGPYESTESDEGYNAFHYASLCFEGVFRNAQEIRDEIQKQIRQAMYGVNKSVGDMQTASGIKDKVAQHWIEQLLAKAKELKKSQPGRSLDSIVEELQKWLDNQPGDKIKPLLDIAGLDPSQDTPVEILHTILLGIVKYIWHMLHTSMSEAVRTLFAVQLQATDIDGLTVPPIHAAYMMQYRNNLIGKHFKTLMQTMAFHIHDIATPAQFNLMKAVGSLGAMLWVHEIKHMEAYLNDLEVLIGNVLDAFGDVDPAKILIKIKLHLLLHLISDIRRFGPAIHFSTEVFECYNVVFRLCSIYSNHQAPSRDIALKFSSMDRIKHMLSGRYYWSEKDKRWIQAGKSVLNLLHSEPVIQRHLGWVAPVKLMQGRIRTESKRKSAPIRWSVTTASKHFVNVAPPPSSLWRCGVTVTAQNGDKCSPGSWVFFKDGSETQCIGRIDELLVHEEGAMQSPAQLVTVDCFVLGDSSHPDFECPVLRRADTSLSEGSPSKVIESHEIQFLVSVQHDCRLPQHQERQETEKMNLAIAHGDDNHFVINMFGLHNSSILQKPKPLYTDRKAHHSTLAATLWTTQDAKSTLALNRAKKQAVEAQKDGPIDTEEEEEIFLDKEDPMEHLMSLSRKQQRT